MHSDEMNLVKLAQAGDVEAFGELYRQFSPGVFNLAFRMLGNRDDAEDLTQEAFIRAHKSLPAFKGEARFTTWLYRIATNICLDHIRKRKPQVSSDALGEDLNWEPVDEGLVNDPEQQLTRKVTQQAVQTALLSMGEHYRVLIVLRHLEGLSYEEIAGIVGCSVNSLNVRLHRAREAFRKAVAPHLSSEESRNDLQTGSKDNIALSG